LNTKYKSLDTGLKKIQTNSQQQFWSDCEAKFAGLIDKIGDLSWESLKEPLKEAQDLECWFLVYNI
jgi:hypothetical protein